MMAISLFLMIVLVATFSTTFSTPECAKSVCEVYDKLEIDAQERQEYESRMDDFTRKNNLEAGHEVLKQVMYDMKIETNIEETMPLEIYGIHLQNLLHTEVKKILTTAEAMKQAMDDFEQRITQNITDQLANSVRFVAEEEFDLEKLIMDIVKGKLKPILDLLNITDADLGESLSETVGRLEFKIREEIDKLTYNFLAEHPSTKNISFEKQNEILELLKSSDIKPSDCLDVMNDGNPNTGIYNIYHKGTPFTVYCDMETDGGGWTVFLIRKKQLSQENFKRTWEEYKEGFGKLPGEYWMGNEALHLMTTSKRYSMRTDAVWNGSPSQVWGEWDHFKIDSEENKYKLTLLGYNLSSIMSDEQGFGYNNGQYFSTLDRDNDNWRYNCGEVESRSHGGGFWYNSCSYHFPTQPYGNATGYSWSKMYSGSQSYAEDKVVTEIYMKIRPFAFKNVD